MNYVKVKDFIVGFFIGMKKILIIGVCVGVPLYMFYFVGLWTYKENPSDFRIVPIEVEYVLNGVLFSTTALIILGVIVAFICKCIEVGENHRNKKSKL